MQDIYEREITTEDSKTYVVDGLSITLPELKEGQEPFTEDQIIELFNSMPPVIGPATRPDWLVRPPEPEEPQP